MVGCGENEQALMLPLVVLLRCGAAGSGGLSKGVNLYYSVLFFANIHLTHPSMAILGCFVYADSFRYTDDI